MLVTASLLALAMSFLTACSQGGQSATEEKTVTAGDYMVSVAKSSQQLSSSLKDFAEAISENDITAVQSKADSAYEVLKQMEALEAPDELKSVKGKYDEAVQSLRDALKDYVALYLEVENSPDGVPADYATYVQQIESVQKAYDQGLNLLEEADNMATEM